MAGGGGCEVIGACYYPGNRTIDFGEQVTQYGAGEYDQAPFLAFCINKINVQLEVYEGGWRKVDSTTPIKLITGRNPQLVGGQLYGDCDASSGARATWNIQGAEEGNWLMRIKAWYTLASVVYSGTFTITVNPAPAGVPLYHQAHTP